MISKLGLWTLALVAICGCNISVNGQSGFGLDVTKDATAENVGLPVYPGATLSRDGSHDSPSVKLAAWGGRFGLNLAVMKLESSESPATIAAYYKKQLEKYGPVLDCSNANRTSRRSKHELSCDGDDRDLGTLLFKAGTEENQHIVGIEPRGRGTRFHLVHVEARD